MSNTHFVNSFNDLSIFSRTASANAAKIEWVLKLIVVNEITQKAEVVFETISGSFMSIKVKHDAVNDGYHVKLDRLAAGLAEARSFHEIRSGELSYRFAEDINKHARFIVVDDLSMLLTCVFEGKTINDYMILLNIQDGATPSEFLHQIWHEEEIT
jgi:hypothetical protein